MAENLSDFRDWSLLARGSADQRRAFDLLIHHRPFDRLSMYETGLAGTFPIDLAVSGSDLDILVQADDPLAVGPVLEAAFGGEAGYACRSVRVTDGPALVARFRLGDVPVEIFVQALPVARQMGWRHMMVEARLLALAPALRPAVRGLKQAGIKTEPAFAQLLALPGDPYQALLGLEALSDSALADLLAQRWSAMSK
ncbi:hypothetical protein CHU95_04395 [Niveispirillum lacus]|uniref:DUF4269 domain-containing protein n=1 Tax=Niveispirillum lacus TaxID=1981099 RepID=A0A255Z755_9PROT|nr:DUF4269 domain-containing protein [Niveispirillum lacus]OYQ36470.1 hypothetical protein CHU95_04395 [Niveispirillum lacus]